RHGAEGRLLLSSHASASHRVRGGLRPAHAQRSVVAAGHQHVCAFRHCPHRLNMWCLWNLGRAAEILLGRFSYLLAYFASGIFGSIASVYSQPMSAGAGASGAIFGMAGVLVSFVYLKKTPAHLKINKKMLSSLGTFIFYNLVIGASIPGISNAAHLGGLVMGALLGALLPAASASESS